MAFKSSTVVSGKVAATLADFPEFIDPSAIGMTTQAEVDSSRFYADSGKVVERAREVVAVGEIHCLIESLTDTDVNYCDYDGVRSDYAVTDTYGRNAVWSDTYGVWHLQESSGSTATDSSANNNGTYSGSLPDNRTGKIGNSQHLDGTGDWIFTNYLGRITERTWSGWMKTNTNSDVFLLGGKNAGATRRIDIRLGYGLVSAGAGKIRLEQTTNSGQVTRGLDTNIGINDNAWHKIDVVFSATNILMYKDGAALSLDGSGGTVDTAADFSVDPNIGAFDNNGTPILPYTGEMDEWQVRGVLTANWITTEYNNQDDVSAFRGAWADVGGAPVQNSNFLAFM